MLTLPSSAAPDPKTADVAGGEAFSDARKSLCSIESIWWLSKSDSGEGHELCVDDLDSEWS
jgi:hypothetical protein